MLDGKFYQSGQVTDAQFLHQAAAVGVNGFGGKEQDFGYFRAGFAFDHQLQDLPFAVAEFVKRTFLRRRIPLKDIILDYHIFDAVTQITTPGTDRPHGGHHFFAG